MINLLPPKEKKELASEKRYKLVLILGFLTSLFLIAFLLILFSIKIQIVSQAQNQKILAEAEEKQFETSQAGSLEKTIQTVNQDLSKLTSFYRSQPNLAGVLENISQILPRGIYLTYFSINSGVVSLQGFSPDRQLLFELKKKLESETSFQEIYFSPSNWVESEDIDFHITFQLAP